MADERGGERREGAALVLEAPAELPEQLAPRHAGDALAEEAMEDDGGGDELLDVELFRDIELLLDSGRAEIQEAYLAAIDSLVGDHGDQTMADVDHWNASQPQPLADMELELSLSHQHQTLEEASSKSEALEQGSEESMEDGVYERERELLEREAKFLEAQREFLQFKASAASSNLESFMSPMNMDAGWETRAEDERRSLEAAQRHQAMLSQLLAQHQKSVCALEVALMQAPITHYRLSLMTPMESYIHLGKDPKERRAMLMSLRDTKIDAVQHFIEYQTRHIDPLRDFFYLDTFEKFGKFYTVDFTASFLGNTTLGEVADVIQDQFVIPLDGVSQMLGCVSNREYFDGIEEQFLHARIVDRVDVPRKRLHDRGFVVQESNTVFFRKSFPDRDGFTVLASDYVDKDDLHPYHSRSRIRKDISVGITLRRHVDAATGTSGVIMKRFSFIRHHLQHREPTPELVHAISTRVILWGQALRFFLAGRHPRRGSDEQRVWSQYRFPRLPGSTSTAAGTAGKEQEQELEQGDESGFESAA